MLTMIRITKGASSAVALVMLILCSVAACGEKEQGASAIADTAARSADTTRTTNLTATFSDEQYRLAGIALGAIQSRNLSSVIRLNGVIDVEPSSTAVVSAPMGGYVRSAGLLPGARVTQGQVLATLTNPEFTQLQQDYLESKGRMTFLEQEFARQQRLRREDVNAAKTFEQVASDHAVMRARIAGLEQNMQLAGIPRSAVDSGRISPVANLYAPIAGFIKSSNVSIGKYVAPTDALFEIVNTSELHLALNVYERDLERVRVGQTVRFGTADERTLDRTAEIFLVGQATGNDRIFPVHGHMNGQSALGLLPGMYVRAWLEVGAQTMPAVPVSAVVQFEGKDYIVLETSESTTEHAFRLQQVKRETEQGGYVGIALPAGFTAEGARVVVGNAFAVLAAIKNAQEEG